MAAIGPGTARALARHGIIADIVPERFVAEALIEALGAIEVEGKRVLIARAADARDVLPDGLDERGAEVDVVALYETVREQPDEAAVEAALEADYVTFTSSSTVRNLTEALGERFPRAARIVSIGPVTSEAAREAGLEVAVEAERHDVDGLLDALLARRRRVTPARRHGPGDVYAGVRRIRRDGLWGAAPPLRASPTRPTAAPASWPRRAPPHGTVVTAGEQSEGRGRQGRTWTRAAGQGAALLGDPAAARRAPPAAAPGRPARRLRGGRGASRPASTCAIKWPNDVWVDGRKLAGILIEARPQDGWAVIGVGLNLTIARDEFPPELRETATSLFGPGKGGRGVGRRSNSGEAPPTHPRPPSSLPKL